MYVNLVIDMLNIVQFYINLVIDMLKLNIGQNKHS